MPINMQMRSGRREGLTEAEIKKFFKKCKKAEILQEYLEKTSFHLTKSQKRREKIRKNAYRRNKKNNKYSK
jgi:hypothetical protein